MRHSLRAAECRALFGLDASAVVVTLRLVAR